jgi:hypothetical protein
MCALNTADFAISIDFSRCALKRGLDASSSSASGNEDLWLIRALAFAAMGKILKIYLF